MPAMLQRMRQADVVVLGGGVAGIQAALDLADSGYQVILVEKEPSIGGRMAQIDKTFPTMDCSICILAPKMSEAGGHPNITLHTHSEVLSIDGYIGNFTARIVHKARYVTDVVDEKVSETTVTSTAEPLRLSLPVDSAGVYVVEGEGREGVVHHL